MHPGLQNEAPLAMIEPEVGRLRESRNGFIHHVLERELSQFDEAGSDADITEKLKGLGYIS